MLCFVGKSMWRGAVEASCDTDSVKSSEIFPSRCLWQRLPSLTSQRGSNCTHHLVTPNSLHWLFVALVSVFDDIFELTWFQNVSGWFHTNVVLWCESWSRRNHFFMQMWCELETDACAALVLPPPNCCFRILGFTVTCIKHHWTCLLQACHACLSSQLWFRLLLFEHNFQILHSNVLLHSWNFGFYSACY